MKSLRLQGRDLRLNIYARWPKETDAFRCSRLICLNPVGRSLAERTALLGLVSCGGRVLGVKYDVV